MDTQVGDRITYRDKYSFNTRIAILINDGFVDKEIDILKIERIGTNGWYTVYEKKEEILDGKEKEYLRNLIKPFKDKVKYISKCNPNNKEEFIYMKIEGSCDLDLPRFKKGTMYRKMEQSNKYTLSELGLE